jgi:hypothetical protein
LTLILDTYSLDRLTKPFAKAKVRENMSIQETQIVSCPACGSDLEIEVFHSLNPSRQKEAVELIIEDRLQMTQCKCGRRVRLEPEFIYMDIENKMCIAAYPAEEIENRYELEVNAKVSFDKAFSKSFVGEGIKNRITFGWPALKEKVLAQKHAISDVDLELVKLALIKESGQMPDSSTSLRLINVEESHLIFGWNENLAPYQVTSVQPYDRDILDHIKENESEWAPLKQEIDQGLFVDLARLIQTE